MFNPKKLSISAALIVLICFFLPWVQVSCGGSQDTVSGIGLAREGHGELWLIPMFMLAVILVNAMAALRERHVVSALVNLLAGLVSTYLINRERVRAANTSGLLEVRVTVWLWLSLVAAILLAFIAGLQLLKRPRSPT